MILTWINLRPALEFPLAQVQKLNILKTSQRFLMIPIILITKNHKILRCEATGYWMIFLNSIYSNSEQLSTSYKSVSNFT